MLTSSSFGFAYFKGHDEGLVKEPQMLVGFQYGCTSRGERILIQRPNTGPGRGRDDLMRVRDRRVIYVQQGGMFHQLRASVGK